MAGRPGAKNLHSFYKTCIFYRPAGGGFVHFGLFARRKFGTFYRRAPACRRGAAGRGGANLCMERKILQGRRRAGD